MDRKLEVRFNINFKFIELNLVYILILFYLDYILLISNWVFVVYRVVIV